MPDTTAETTRIEPRWLDDRQQHAWRRLAAVILKLPSELEHQLQTNRADERPEHLHAYHTPTFTPSIPQHRVFVSTSFLAPEKRW